VIFGEVRSAKPCIDRPAFLRANRNRCPNMISLLPKMRLINYILSYIYKPLILVIVN
jgi:hypothetical protein